MLIYFTNDCFGVFNELLIPTKRQSNMSCGLLENNKG
jgi:hypothetical protein